MQTVMLTRGAVATLPEAAVREQPGEDLLGRELPLGDRAGCVAVARVVPTVWLITVRHRHDVAASRQQCAEAIHREDRRLIGGSDGSPPDRRQLSRAERPPGDSG